MREQTGITTIEKMFEADKKACQVLDEAKEKAKTIIQQAEIEACKLIDKTNSDLQHNHESLKRKLIIEAEKQVDTIKREKKEYLQKIEGHFLQCHKKVMQELKKILFENL